MTAQGDFWKPIGSLTKGDLETLMGRPERTVLDYKQALNPSHVGADALAEDLCAFANTGVGRLVFGAEEGDRDELARLVGVPNAEIRKIRSKIRNAAHSVQPPVDVDIQDVAVTNDSSVLVVEVRPSLGRRPHQYKGKYLLRSADGNTFMQHSNVVTAVLATHGSRGDGLMNYGPRESGFRTIHPFGADSPAGWFFGVQVSMDWPLEPIFAVFDEIGQRLMTMAKVQVAELARPVVAELERVFTDRDHQEGVAAQSRFQIETDGTFSEFDRLRDAEAIDVASLLDGIARERVVRLAKFATEAAPAGWFQVSLAIWGTSMDDLKLKWTNGTGQVKNHSMVSLTSRRRHFPSEWTVRDGAGVADLLWRFDNHLRLHAKAPLGPSRPVPFVPLTA